MIAGEISTKEGYITHNEGRETVTLTISNTGDRPVQVGSHFHFFEVNKLLAFPREQAHGMRLDIPSGTSVRFEPGEQKEVTLVSLGNRSIVHGLNNLVGGCAKKETLENSLQKAKDKGFFTEEGEKSE